MRNAIVQLCFVVMVITGIHAMRLMQANTITGNVSSPTALQYVWAIQGKDSVIAPAVNGNFALKVTPGIWKLLLHTKSHYKNMAIDSVIVNDGKATDLGEIKLLAK
jgi:hypothetical protein